MDKFVVHIFASSDESQPMQSVEAVCAITGADIEKDVLAVGDDEYIQAQFEIVRHISLVSLEAREQENDNALLSFYPKGDRWNIVTLGVDLGGLVGKEFVIGGARLRGLEPCQFSGHVGLLAEIVVGGIIRIGDSIHALG